ncbi:MAG: FliM/FliN family flagellar motor C-terminal domain-containing protein [Candidatus Sulfotelmatobacter sp.]
MAMAMEKAAAPGSLANAAAPEAAPALAQDSEDDARWKPALELPCDLLVDLPLPNFKVADLLKLRPGSVIDARWRVGRDVPLRLNGTLIGWIEFEVMGEKLAVRLTELA